MREENQSICTLYQSLYIVVNLIVWHQEKPSSSSTAIHLTEYDILGTKLQEPLKAHTFPALYSGGFYVKSLKLHQTGESHS